MGKKKRKGLINYENKFNPKNTFFYKIKNESHSIPIPIKAAWPAIRVKDTTAVKANVIKNNFIFLVLFTS